MSKFDHVNWMDQVYKDYEKNNDVKANAGFGKPLPKKMFSGDVHDNFVNTARNAGYLPEWIKLQKEIRTELGEVVTAMNVGQPAEEFKREIRDINKKIKKYNKACPPSMQRMMIELDDVKGQHEIWA
ncbi:DUF1992 domain-containing protein [Jeotgalibacillus marinus]|uniref:DUF1992 domain-containing protein n=1 Tax=Jeotgalibacillus marinus TaxID=86667 RepID=A0ABV3Q7V2_9BACL